MVEDVRHITPGSVAVAPQRRLGRDRRRRRLGRRAGGPRFLGGAVGRSGSPTAGAVRRDAEPVVAAIPPPFENGFGDEGGVGGHGRVVPAVRGGGGDGLKPLADEPSVLQGNVPAACELRRGGGSVRCQLLFPLDVIQSSIRCM